jgi:hypothetical protein
VDENSNQIFVVIPIASQEEIIDFKEFGARITKVILAME